MIHGISQILLNNLDGGIICSLHFSTLFVVKCANIRVENQFAIENDMLKLF